MEQQYYSIPIKDFVIGKGEPLTIISGPCVIEDEHHTLLCAERLQKIMNDYPVNFIFKASCDKANRSSVHSFRGPGMEKGLKILQKVKEKFNLPILTDIHLPEQAKMAAEVCDMLQVPAFLCRQTDLIVAAAETKKPVLVKKGQFLAPHDMGNVVEKFHSVGNYTVMLCDRGTSFGYNALINDIRAIPVMQKFRVPVCFDASHSTQKPTSTGQVTGGDREFIPVLARAAVAAGADAIFIESHPNPSVAKSDAATVYPLDELPQLLQILVELYAIIQK